MDSYFLNGFRDKTYFVICPLCGGSEDINCEICFNERRRLFYLPAVPLKSAVVVWAASPAERVVYFVDSEGMFTLELDKKAWDSLANIATDLEELNYIYIPSNAGKYKNELTIELNEIG